jgi:uncharacterized protein YjbI with pentapeptide repeats
MANREHFLFLFQSIASGDCRAWNNWRIENHELHPSLAGLELWDLNLPFINLSGSDLRLANLRSVNLYRANLQNSDLSMAILKNSNLREANLKGAKLFHANLRDADLRGANLSGADLRHADLTGALLSDANLSGATMDAGALEQSGDLHLESGVSRLEKIALRFSRNRAAKRMDPAVAKAKKAVHP